MPMILRGDTGERDIPFRDLDSAGPLPRSDGVRRRVLANVAQQPAEVHDMGAIGDDVLHSERVGAISDR